MTATESEEIASRSLEMNVAGRQDDEAAGSENLDGPDDGIEGEHDDGSDWMVRR